VQEKDEKPKRSRKPVAAPAAKAVKAEPIAEKKRKPIAKKEAEAASPSESIDEKASQIAAQLFGDESAASEAPAPVQAAQTPPGQGHGQHRYPPKKSQYLMWSLMVLLLLKVF